MLTKEQIFTVLNEWNPWKKKLDEGILRESYLSDIIKLINLKEIIVLTGVRRSGKSTLLRQVIGHLIGREADKGADPGQILFVNFEDPRFAADLNLELLDQIFETYLEFVNPQGEIFLFLDEIQVIPSWEKWVRSKHELKKANIFVTGSSSKLLSREFGTVLSGRYVQKKVYPLSFKEFLTFNGLNINDKKDILLHSLEIKRFLRQFLQTGSFPKISLVKEEEHKKLELNAYFDSIILKDIVARYKLKNFANLKKLALFLLTNIAKPHTINSLKNSVGLPFDTCESYLEYLQEVFLIFAVANYNYSLKEQYKKPNKIYCIDLGLRNLISFRFSKDIGRLYENMVFLELKRRRKEVYFYKEKKECDFLIKEGLKIKAAIQVAENLDENNQPRELEGLLEVLDKFRLKEGLIVSENKEGTSVVKGKKIKYLPLWKWLLLEEG